jgi:hypothetical protein
MRIEQILLEEKQDFLFLAFMLGARLSTWKNTYLPNAKQLIFTEQEMNQWIVDNIEAGKDLEKYAKYLTGLFNKEGLSVTVFEKDGKEILGCKICSHNETCSFIGSIIEYSL